MAEFPPSSFMNLFKKIVYDKMQNPNPTLDIWDAYVISPFYKNELQYFQLYTVTANDTWVSLANSFYNDQRLWWVIPLFNDIEDPFLVMDPNVFLDDVPTQLKVLRANHLNQLLLQARQQKIINDRQTQQEGYKED